MKVVLIQLFFCIFVLETTAYYFLIHSSNALFRARRVLQYDSQLGWRQQANLDTVFEQSALITDEEGFRVAGQDNTPSAEAEVLTLGPSSAFGWGVGFEKTYAARVAKAMGISGFNGAQIGHSIVQGQTVWKLLKPRFKKLQYVLIGYGVNDLDNFPFYTDSGYFPHEELSNFLTVFSLALMEGKIYLDCSQLEDIKQRVPLSEYLVNLRDLVSDLQSIGITPILINTPYLYSPARQPPTSDIYSEYRLVGELAAKGSCFSAREQLQRAKLNEPARVARDIARLNLALLKFAKEERIPIVDAAALLGSAAKLNFVDPVHPSEAGHKKIARQIVQIMMKFNNGK